MARRPWRSAVFFVLALPVLAMGLSSVAGAQPLSSATRNQSREPRRERSRELSRERSWERSREPSREPRREPSRELGQAEFEQQAAPSREAPALHKVLVVPFFGAVDGGTAHCAASFTAGMALGVLCTVLAYSMATAEKTSLRLTSSLLGSPTTRACEPDDDGMASRSSMSVVESCTGPIESIHLFWPRCYFLVAMLLLQSMSSVILSGHEDLIREHPGLIYFLTMIVGTGGNVGGQSVVLAVRRLSYGEEVNLSEQFRVGLQLCLILAPLSLLRTWVQGTGHMVTFVIAVATGCVTVVAAVLGTALPKFLALHAVDPAHATPVIQVLMDMIGVLVTCTLGYLIMDAAPV